MRDEGGGRWEENVVFRWGGGWQLGISDGYFFAGRQRVDRFLDGGRMGWKKKEEERGRDDGPPRVIRSAVV